MAIILLDTKIINRIAAGEVIERPASVVKELVENAIDAESSEIEIKIESGGRNLITITDDGDGIEKSDLELAFTRHATSKLSDSELIEIKYLGFRGEALPSIAAVSRIKLSSKANRANEAWSICYEGGEKIGEPIPYSLSQGTHIEVRDLFFATPNRLKFLKTERAETQSIVDIVNTLAMTNYSIGFTLTSSSKKLLKYAKQTSLFSRLCEIEEEFQDNSLEINEEEDGVRLTGHICKPTVNRGKSDMIYTFVNGRPIKDNLLVGAIRCVYHDFIPSGRYPFAALHLEIPYDQIDVNVHPNKSEVRFQNKKLIYEIVRRGLIKALSTKIGTSTANDIDRPGSQGIGEELSDLPFDVSESQENNKHINNGKNRETESERELYKRKPSPFENQLMKEFNSPNIGEKSLPERSVLFDCTGVQKSSLQAETVVLKREQIDLIESHPLGFARCQVYNTYIIAEAKGKLIIVDQHAAHERLVYECLKQKASIKRQKLLLSEVVEIKNQVGMEMVKVYKNKLFEMGFDIEIKSENKVIVKEIPAILGAIDVKEMLIDIVDRLIEVEDTLPIEDKVNKILATIACCRSIRAGRTIKLEEMNVLLRQMEKTPYSGQCNHGRPTYIEVKLSDIEKLFKRR
ncbi:DNA mismatch repair endonuclease MutL [Wolbachia endosymbiont of Litomosoides brasiliensis]|uniref:DNA mismatch repair endonuclease MutL n=1 Tax=Wolbachia endosymbiont of Litomosoides brasiliensis TaxID=1812117 RepID=UPI00158C3986|nr:DNA mismatch repair endonuclease MutL [Wolbachia endosymbiont of Litomosoides brasiliensis]NUY39442.1 DNA mismatch repair endonuclease MutL [Wolbachia endosymbiont of Litomosoides brasiliensis]